MTRERVIVDIEDLGQAAKVEDTVKTGYCDYIKDYLVHWIAVEEDLTESYRKLADKLNDPKVKKTLEEFASESKENVSSLRKLMKSIDSFSEAKIKRREILGDMVSKSR